MGMSVGPSDGGEEDRVMNEINTTPLVDVMLVLLIIFMITIPVVTTSIKVNLPKERVEERESKPDNIVLSADSAGNMYWYDQRVASVDVLVEKLKKVSTLKPQPEIHIRGDMASRYEPVGKMMLAAQRAGIVKVSFITEPPARGG